MSLFSIKYLIETQKYSRLKPTVIFSTRWKSFSGRIWLKNSPTAYKGFADCKAPKDWGVSIGDTVELSGRYDGKKSRLADFDPAYKNLRYILDDDIVGKISPEVVKQLINGDK